MNHLPPSSGKPRRPGHRLWIPAGIALLAAAGLVALEWRPDLDRNFQLWAQSALGLLAAMLILAWFLLLSRFPGRVRLATFAALLVAGLGLWLALRVDGTFDGRGLPRLVWKWAPVPVAPPAPSTQLMAPPLPAPVAAPLADVPQFFGPQRDGRILGAGLARDWAATPPREVWRQPIGTGWSAFAVVGGRAYTQEQRGQEEWVTCYEALTGRLLWAHRRPARFFQWQAGEGPHSTPTVDRGQVFAYGATGILDCLDAATGALVWSRAVLAENNLDNLEWGVSASPLLVGDLVVVTGGNSAGPTVLAYARATGEPRWRGGTDRASYSSPILGNLAGRPLILSFNAATLTAHDPATGEVQFSHRWGNERAPKAAQPVVVDAERVFVTAGYGMGCELLRVITQADGRLAVESLWKNIRLKAQFNSVAIRDGFFFGLDDGFLACVEVATGERRWKEGRYGSGQTLLVDDLMLVQSERGHVALVEASPVAFRELGRLAALSSKTWNHPTLAGRFLLVRNDREAVCYELPAASAAATEG